METIKKACGILIKDRKLLVTRTKGKHTFVGPGGKFESAETAQQALIRELREELKIELTEADFSQFGVFKAIAAYDSSKQVEMTVFLVKSWTGEIVPDNEIEEIKWITSSDLASAPVGSIFEHEVIPQLKAQGLID